jgi:magnesium transporter
MRMPPSQGEHHEHDGEAGEQISLFIGEGFVITFQPEPGDCFDPVRQRIGNGRKLVSKGSDYLAYALIDACVDSYFPLLEQIGERVEHTEDRVFLEPHPDQVTEIHDLKRELLHLRRATWPMREMLNSLIREEHKLISADTRIYLRDVYDHAIQLMDIVETYREISSGLMEGYLSSQSARMNEVMKFLTLIATIFIPLSFLAGLWGMNFDQSSPYNLPELKWYFGYPIALGVMLTLAVGMLSFFRWKKWL